MKRPVTDMRAIKRLVCYVICLYTIEKCDQIGTPKTGNQYFLNNPFWNGSLTTQSKFGFHCFFSSADLRKECLDF